MKSWTAGWPRASSISRVEDLIFTRRRLSLCGYTFLAANVAAFAVHFVAGNWLIDRSGNCISTDFLQWWLGSRVALGRGAAAVYNDSTFSAARTLVTKSAPPRFLIFTMFIRRQCCCSVLR